MANTSEIFVRNLKKLRKAKFPKQDEFAPKVNLSQRGYQKYETGESSPTPEVLDRFAKALGCSPIDLICPDPHHPASSNDILHIAEFLSRLGALPADAQSFVVALVYGSPQVISELPGRLSQKFRNAQ